MNFLGQAGTGLEPCQCGSWVEGGEDGDWRSPLNKRSGNIREGQIQKPWRQINGRLSDGKEGGEGSEMILRLSS